MVPSPTWNSDDWGEESMKNMREGGGLRKILVSSLIVTGLMWATAGIGLTQVSPRHRRMVMRPGPEFTLTLFSGKKVELKDFRGKVVLLNFWHSG